MTHRWDPNRYNHSGVKVDLRLTITKRYFTFPTSPRWEPHHQMVWCHIQEIRWQVWGGSYYSAEMQLVNFTVPDYWALVFDLASLFKVILSSWVIKSQSYPCRRTEVVPYHIYPTPPLGQDMTQGQFFKRSFTGLNSEFSFS